MAVTSIPVISRIMHDTGLLGTRFSRIVLSVAVIEDIVVYVILAVAIGLVQASGSTAFGTLSETGSVKVTGWQRDLPGDKLVETFLPIGIYQQQLCDLHQGRVLIQPMKGSGTDAEIKTGLLKSGILER